MNSNKGLFFLILYFFLIFKLIQSFEYVSIQFQNLDCSGIPIVIYSSTQCSPAGYFNVEGETVHVTVANNIKSINDCYNAQPNYDDLIDKCSNGFKTYFNLNSNISLPDGYCAEVKLLSGGNCQDHLELISYKDGVCIEEGHRIYYRYVCDGKKTKRYACASDCTKNIDNCQFDKVLDSIDKCPSIKSRSINQITGDNSIKSPTTATTATTTNNNNNNNGTHTNNNNNNNNTNGNNNKNDGGEENNSTAIITINLLFVTLLSLLIILQ